MGEMPIFQNSNSKQYKNKFDQTVAGSAWLNTQDKDDPLRTKKIKEVSDLILKYNLTLYVIVKDTNGGDYTQHTEMTAITLFPQGERFKTENTTTVENTTTAETTESNKDEEDELDF
tara:strand:- start:2488 stop:2838 length:351 start_codon:yes stop_codon:yes gene_type:complete